MAVYYQRYFSSKVCVQERHIFQGVFFVNVSCWCTVRFFHLKRHLRSNVYGVAEWRGGCKKCAEVRKKCELPPPFSHPSVPFFFTYFFSLQNPCKISKLNATKCKHSGFLLTRVCNACVPEKREVRTTNDCFLCYSISSAKPARFSVP